MVGYILSLLQNELTPSSSAHQISAKINLRTAAQLITQLAGSDEPHDMELLCTHRVREIQRTRR